MSVNAYRLKVLTIAWTANDAERLLKQYQERLQQLNEIIPTNVNDLQQNEVDQAYINQMLTYAKQCNDNVYYINVLEKALAELRQVYQKIRKRYREYCVEKEEVRNTLDAIEHDLTLLRQDERITAQRIK